MKNTYGEEKPVIVDFKENALTTHRTFIYLLFDNAQFIACVPGSQYTLDAGMFKKFPSFFVMSFHNTILHEAHALSITLS